MVILGPNGSGKSNLFDAIQLLSRLAVMPLRKAISDLRGEPHELFSKQADGQPGTRMAFAVEVLLNPNLHNTDMLGTQVEIKYSRLRYEVEIERTNRDRVFITREEARLISAKDDSWVKGIYQPSRNFKDAFIKRKQGQQSSLLSTETKGAEGRPAVCYIYQDGTQGRARKVQISNATVLSSYNNAEFPHLYALREELGSFHLLQLDPIELRKPSPTLAPEDELESNGANLASVLHRIQETTSTELRPRGDIPLIAADLSSLINGVLGFDVVRDEWNREYRIDICMRGNQSYSSRVVSDGTLRVLALLTLFYQSKHWGLIGFEEPENGVHPWRLKQMIRRLRELVTDTASSEPDVQKPFSQMLLNSHSPVVLSGLENGEVVFAEMVSRVNSSMNPARRTRFTPVIFESMGAGQEGKTNHIPAFQAEQYLLSALPGEH